LHGSLTRGLGLGGTRSVARAWSGCRFASGCRNARLRVLALIDVSCPPFTSLIGPARRLYASARSVHAHREQRVTPCRTRSRSCWPFPECRPPSGASSGWARRASRCRVCSRPERRLSAADARLGPSRW